jgi:hypothetical protein
MKTRLLTRISGMTLASLLTLTGLVVLGFRPAAHAEGGGIEDTWLGAVKIVTCPPAPYEVITTFESMSTYMRGGTLIEGGAPPPPAILHSAGHGIWERTGGHTFRSFFRSHHFNANGSLVGIVGVTGHAHLIKGDNLETPDVIEPYYLSSKGNTNRITNIDPVDGTVIDVIEGCSEATYRPVLFED